MPVNWFSGIRLGVVLAMPLGVMVCEAYPLQPAPNIEDLENWVRLWEPIDGVEVVWRREVPVVDSGEAPSDKRFEFLEISQFLWPCCFRRTEDWKSSLAAKSNALVEPHIEARRSGRVVTLTEAGDLIDQAPALSEFRRVRGAGTLEQLAHQHLHESPMVAAHWLAAELRSGLTLERVSNAIVARPTKAPRAQIWFEESASTALRLIRVDVYDERGRIEARYDFSDFREVSGMPTPVPFARTRFQPLEGDVFRELGTDRLQQAFVAPLAPTDFQVDLSHQTAFNPRTGEVTDAEGNVVGHGVPQWRTPLWLQWTIFLGSSGLALAVGVLGVWYLRRVRS